MSTAESAPATEPRGGEEPDAGAELARRVFTGQERWGWEFVQPSAPPAHRDAQHPPVYSEPSGDEVRAMEERAMTVPKNRGTGCLLLLAGI
ncbi:hypothetical protein, partial [Streptomyces cucumeris]